MDISRSSIFGKSTEIESMDDSVVHIGNSCVISAETLIKAFDAGNINISNRVFINKHCQIISKDLIRIESNCTVGPNVMIYDHDHVVGQKNKYLSAPIVIEENVWIGAGAIILKGITVGRNSVIAAGAIVTHDVPENTIYMNRVQPVYKKIESMEE